MNIQPRNSSLLKREMSFDKRLPKDFGSLKVTLLVRIFGYIELNELLKYTSLVCKHWRYAAMQPQFMRTLYVVASEPPLRYIFNHLRKSISLKELHLEGVKDPIVVILQAAKFCKNMEKISLINYENMDVAVLRQIVQLYPNLCGLNLERTCFIGEHPFYTNFLALPKLRSLNLTKNKYLTMNIILETVLNCRALEDLNISLLPPQVDLTDDDACLILSHLAKNLKSLSFDSRSLTSKTYMKMLNCDKLEKLFLKYAGSLTSMLLKKISIHLTNLRQFGFSHNYIVTANDFYQIIEDGVAIYSNIIFLDFTYCVLFNNESVSAIYTYIPNIRKMCFKCCQNLTDIDQLTTSCQYLEMLDISFCTALKPTFNIPNRLEKLIVHEGDWFSDLIRRARLKLDLRIFMSVSEYEEDLKRI